MLKKITASVLALTMVFGTGALTMAKVMPDTAITASADEVYGDFKYTYDSKTDSVKITGYTGSAATVKIPSQIGGKKVGIIGASAFQHNEKITGVTIPNGVTTIGDSAFIKCKNLKTVNIPDSVQKIEMWAFNGCESLTSIRIPYGVEEIPVLAFFDCKSLTSVTIPGSVTKIAFRAFEGCTSLKSVTIPNSVTEIAGMTFYKCPNLKTVDIPASVKKIDEAAFGYTEYLGPTNNKKVSGFKIRCYEGSAAEKYAKNNGFAYENYKPSEYLGNVNGDKVVDIEDVTMIINHINGVGALTGAQIKRADVDSNGTIDVEDAVAIINHINGISRLF